MTFNINVESTEEAARHPQILEMMAEVLLEVREATTVGMRTRPYGYLEDSARLLVNRARALKTEAQEKAEKEKIRFEIAIEIYNTSFQLDSGISMERFKAGHAKGRPSCRQALARADAILAKFNVEAKDNG